MAPIIVWVLLCATLWGLVASRLANGQAIIPFEPRRPAPWVWQFATVMAILLFLGGIFAVASSAIVKNRAQEPHVNEAEHAEPDVDDSAKLVEMMLVGSLMQLGLIGGLLFALRVTSGAGARDFGLDFRRVGYDIRTGLLAFVAVSVPTYGLQYLAIKFVKDPSHPIINALSENSSRTVLLASLLLTVIIAPIAEEILFRVLLQGFFEAIVVRLRSRGTPLESLGEEPSQAAERVEDISTAPAEDSPETFHVEPTWSEPLPTREPLIETSPGMIPIVLSAAIFALAHVNYGPSAIPLFFFGLALGYLYQQTHRLLPSVVLHMSLNGTTMLALVVQSLTDA